MKFRKDLQSVRFISMILVFYFHKKKTFFKGGFIGVDIFFTLSGYFITGSLLRRMNKSDYFLSFFKGRILRLQPMSSLILIVIYITSLSNSYISYKRAKEIIACLYSFANYYYYYISVNYLEVSNRLNTTPLLHFWSLSVEYQFYMLWPCVIFHLCSNVDLNYIIILFLGSFLYSMYISYHHINYSYYSFEVRLCELLLGSYLNTFPNTKINKCQIVYDFIIIFMLILSCKLCSIGIYPDYKMIYPLCTSIIMLYKEANSKSLLSLNLFQRLGSISYSFYILHYPLVTYYPNVSIFTVLFISIICYSLIEEFFVNINVSYPTVFSVSIVLTLFITLLQYKSYKTYVKNQNNPNRCSTMFIQYLNTFTSCIFNKRYNDIMKIKNNYILLLGDSHIMQWSHTILKQFKCSNIQVVLLTFWINYFLDDKYLIVKSVIEIIGSPYYIFESYFCDPLHRKNIYIRNFVHLNSFLSNISNKLIIIVDNPTLYFNPLFHYSSVNRNKNLYCVININCTIDIQPVINLKNIHYINLTSFYCAKNKCHLYKKGIQIYSDVSHLTDCFIKYMEKIIQQKLHALNVTCFKNINGRGSFNISLCGLNLVKWYNGFKQKINMLKLQSNAK